jgi:hypothetical protein
MNRRHFLRSAGATCLLAGAAPAEGWRTFEVKTHVEILKPSGTTRVWAPAALLRPTPFQRTLSNEFSAAGRARIAKASADGLGILVAEFQPA